MSVRLHQLIKYLLIGGSAFLVEYVLFLLLLDSMHGPHELVASQTLSFCAGLLVSFTGNRIFTFRRASEAYHHSTHRQFWLYASLALANLLITSVLISLLVDVISLVPAIAKLLVMVAVASWNFIIFSKFIFKSSGL